MRINRPVADAEGQSAFKICSAPYSSMLAGLSATIIGSSKDLRLECELSSLIPGPGRRFEMISLVGNRRFSSDKVQDNCKYSDMLCKGQDVSNSNVFPSASPVRHQTKWTRA